MTTRAFSHSDQLAFAELSGDFNPLHVDPTAARRLLFGGQVVHGVHLLLWALDCWLSGREAPVSLSRIQADFQRPVGLGDLVRCEIGNGSDNRCVISLFVGSLVMTRVQLEWINCDGHPSAPRLTATIPERPVCRDRNEEDLRNAAGKIPLYLHEGAVNHLVPQVARLMAPYQVAALLATTRLVGMECPGLHSIYSRLELSLDGGAKGSGPCEEMAYLVSGLDSRFNLLAMNVSAPGVVGTIRAFVRPLPREQISTREGRSLVRDGEFMGQRALVIGGSRGLGEVTAKLLAAGGAEVVISYHQGQDDAMRVVDDILSTGGVAECVHLDVLSAGLGQGGVGSGVPTHLYYFATPFISGGVRKAFSAELFQRFVEFYVTGFARISSTLVDLGVRKIFYPSSVFVDDPPLDMGEYATAKAAGEIAGRCLERCHPGVTVYCPRLPRMQTDQTASLVPVSGLDPASVMLEHLRALGERAD